MLCASVLFTACAGSATQPVRAPVPVSAPTPAPARSDAPPPPQTAPVVGDSARSDWHRLDYQTDGVIGVGSERALRELLASRKPTRTVVVAVIDGGVDTAHTMLAPNLWRNTGEIGGNGQDDDGNGFVDDVRGWSLLHTRDGTAVRHDTFELTRLYAACRKLAAGRGVTPPAAPGCDRISAAYQEKARELSGTLAQIRGLSSTLAGVTAALETAIGSGPLTSTRVRGYTPASAQLEQAKRVWLELESNGLNVEELAKARDAYASQNRYGLDTLFNPRSEGVVVGMGDVTGPDASHGTHVAGIIGAARASGLAVQGIAPAVALMAVRAVPDGDERDHDVARAIRYAADNGAHIINMSFGKSYSPGKLSVDSAVRYAQEKGVLLVHAAGNDGANNDASASYPTSILDDGTRAMLWLEVGASSWKGLPVLAASFSNYGRTRVDLFAPGEDVLSTTPGGTVKRESGTSMAAPVVSGVAALLMSYFPEFTAAQVREILVESARTFPSLQVERPGDGVQVSFSELSRTGGVIDAYAAVKLALQRSAPRP